MNASTQKRLSLRAFQDAFASALAADEHDDAARSAFAAQPGFAVYRNTTMQGCVDALRANFPAVARLVGDEWFRGAASIFARNHLPRVPSLLDYDERFPEFLATFAPAADLPYLADVARLDRFWSEAHVSRDAPCVSAGAVAQLSSVQLADSRLRPHPSARWRRFEMPVYSIWRCNREDTNPDVLADLEWRAEGALIVRPKDEVDSLPIDAAECAFLDACGRGAPLGEAGLAAFAAEPDTDLASLLERLLRAGAFSGLVRVGRGRGRGDRS